MVIVLNYALCVFTNQEFKNLIDEFKVFDKHNFGWTDIIEQSQWQFMYGTANIILSKIIHPTDKKFASTVLGIIRALCVEMQKWVGDHKYIETTDIDVEECVNWLYEGFIDREGTAKQLVINENLPIQSRFELACNYCFMHYIENLWNLMSEAEKRRYSGDYMQNNRIVSFWTKWVTSGARKDLLLSADKDFDQLCFNAYYTNPLALSYFLHLLTAEDKEKYLTKIAREKFLIPRVMSFCLSEMNKNQKVQMFKKTPFKTLKCFLDFPWQNLFIATASSMWPYLGESDFIHLIYFIIYERITAEWYDYNYIELLFQFFCQSPEHFKLYALNEDIFGAVEFILGRRIDQGFVSISEVKDFMKHFILPVTSEKRYRKACRSY